MSNPYAPPQAVVQDIADPYAGIDHAGRGARLGAAILDSFVFGVMVYLPLIVAAIGQGAAERAGAEDVSPIVVFGFILTLAGFVAWLWLTLLFMSRNGQSIAKKMVGIKVVRSDGSAVTLGRLVWLRNVVNWIISIIPLYGLIDVLFIFGESRQCLHDKIADTIVVKA